MTTNKVSWPEFAKALDDRQETGLRRLMSAWELESNILLSSPPGTGKTTFGCRVEAHLKRSQKSVLMIDFGFNSALPSDETSVSLPDFLDYDYIIIDNFDVPFQKFYQQPRKIDEILTFWKRLLGKKILVLSVTSFGFKELRSVCNNQVLAYFLDSTFCKSCVGIPHSLLTKHYSADYLRSEDGFFDSACYLKLEELFKHYLISPIKRNMINKNLGHYQYAAENDVSDYIWEMYKSSEELFVAIDALLREEFVYCRFVFEKQEAKNIFKDVNTVYCLLWHYGMLFRRDSDYISANKMIIGGTLNGCLERKIHSSHIDIFADFSFDYWLHHENYQRFVDRFEIEFHQLFGSYDIMHTIKLGVVEYMIQHMFLILAKKNFFKVLVDWNCNTNDQMDVLLVPHDSSEKPIVIESKVVTLDELISMKSESLDKFEKELRQCMLLSMDYAFEYPECNTHFASSKLMKFEEFVGLTFIFCQSHCALGIKEFERSRDTTWVESENNTYPAPLVSKAIKCR